MAKKSKPNKKSADCAPGMGPMREERGASIREISNGFIVSEYKTGAKGYSSTETFHKTKPILVTEVKPKS